MANIKKPKIINAEDGVNKKRLGGGNPPKDPAIPILGRNMENKVKVKSLSCVQLCDPKDCSPPGSSIHGIFQARVLEWGATAFSHVIKHTILANVITVVLWGIDIKM